VRKRPNQGGGGFHDGVYARTVVMNWLSRKEIGRDGSKTAQLPGIRETSKLGEAMSNPGKKKEKGTTAGLRGSQNVVVSRGGRGRSEKAI